ncbi:NifU family protein [Reichenbachiella versicolor]|uniref:NifU family protein n=1 Tax=Reichenbachiella versicolor TaxID=1821036 RepID=UPI000D6E9EC3|nr:NifU family protein [Reichenbachiella versicolor]
MENQDLLTRVEKAIENIRPYLAEDGGDVKVVEIDSDNVVNVELLGSCETCPMSHMTMKAGIEEAIKKMAPEITAVKAVNATTA